MGGRCSQVFPQEDMDLVAPAVWDALAKVHALSLPGGLPVLTDCRPRNVMIRYVLTVVQLHLTL